MYSQIQEKSPFFDICFPTFFSSSTSTVQTFPEFRKKEKEKKEKLCVFEEYLQAGHVRERLTIKDLRSGSDPV